jgi:hypothetical protein
MARFNLNRQMALILALVATLLTSPMLTGTAFSGSIGGGGVPTPEGPGGDQKGDPDVPTGPSRITPRGASRVVVSPSSEVQTVGDGRMALNVWMWRLRIVLHGLRAYTFRF